jgi:MFS superfamily sulfate permease-like transporter
MSAQWFTSKQQQNTQNRRDSNNQDKDPKQEQDPNHPQVVVLKVQAPNTPVKRKWLTQKITRLNETIDADLAVKSNG